MGKRFAAVGMAAALGVGGLAVAAVNPLTVAGAQDATEAPAGPGGQAPQHQGALQRALDKLVADKTITQDQADKVLEATKAEADSARDQRKERFQANRDELLQTVADALGSTPDEVKAALQDGTSIGAQADAAGVERSKVEQALTDLLTGRIDQAVQDGKLTEERAAQAKEHVGDAVARIMDADGSHRGFGPGRFRGRGGN